MCVCELGGFIESFYCFVLAQVGCLAVTTGIQLIRQVEKVKLRQSHGRVS